MLTDLLGDPYVPPTAPVPEPPPAVSTLGHLYQKRQSKLFRGLKKMQKKLKEGSTLLLFEEVLEFLRLPLMSAVPLPNEFRSDCGEVDVIEVEDDEVVDGLPEIPCDMWGSSMVIDNKRHHWSKEGLLFVQTRLFWRSLEELALRNNEHEKWSVLKWIFRPAIRRDYFYDQRLGKSHCLQWHERDETFSFHNCCIAARMEEDAIREGVRRNIPEDIIEAVERVVLA